MSPAPEVSAAAAVEAAEPQAMPEALQPRGGRRGQDRRASSEVRGLLTPHEAGASKAPVMIRVGPERMVPMQALTPPSFTWAIQALQARDLD